MEDSKTTPAIPEDIKKMSFKEASAVLEQIVRSLETGDLELEHSLAAYKRGVEIVEELKKRLESAEQEVTLLSATLSADGEEE